MEFQDIKEAAVAASEFSYAPYSHFHVGAALLCSDGAIFSGCNIENRSYGLTVCAERSAVSSAVSAGRKEFKAVAVYCRDSNYPVPPCGACRQVLSEFCAPDVPVFFAGKDGKFIKMPMKELYPADSLHDLKENGVN